MSKAAGFLALPIPDVELAIAAMANPDSGIKFILGIAKKAGKRISEVQSVLFDKVKWTAATAKQWLKDHDFTGEGKDEGATFWRFRQQSPGKYKEFRTIVPGTQRNPLRGTDEVYLHLKGWPKPGQRVRVSGNAGVDRNKTGTVVPMSSVTFSGRGIPELPGEYKPWDSKRQRNEVFIQLDSGGIISVHRGWLQAENPIGNLEGEGSHYAVIDGVRVGLGTNNIIIFSTDWEHLWKLAAKGDHRLVKRSGGPETMGHTDLFYVGKDVKAYPSYEENPNGVVRVTADEVSNFKHSWPVSGLPDGYDFYFDFDSRGDLVDLWAQPEGTKYAPIGRNHKDTTRWDGDALVALSQDAQSGKLGAKVNPALHAGVPYTLHVALPVVGKEYYASTGDSDKLAKVKYLGTARNFDRYTIHKYLWLTGAKKGKEDQSYSQMFWKVPKTQAEKRELLSMLNSYEREKLARGGYPGLNLKRLENPTPGEAIASYDEHLATTTDPEFQAATPDEQAAAMTVQDAMENPRQEGLPSWEKAISYKEWFASGKTAGGSPRWSDVSEAWNSYMRGDVVAAPPEYLSTAKWWFEEGFKVAKTGKVPRYLGLKVNPERNGFDDPTYPASASVFSQAATPDEQAAAMTVQDAVENPWTPLTEAEQSLLLKRIQEDAPNDPYASDLTSWIGRHGGGIDTWAYQYGIRTRHEGQRNPTYPASASVFSLSAKDGIHVGFGEYSREHLAKAIELAKKSITPEDPVGFVRVYEYYPGGKLLEQWKVDVSGAHLMHRERNPQATYEWEWFPLSDGWQYGIRNVNKDLVRATPLWVVGAMMPNGNILSDNATQEGRTGALLDAEEWAEKRQAEFSRRRRNPGGPRGDYEYHHMIQDQVNGSVVNFDGATGAEVGRRTYVHGSKRVGFMPDTVTVENPSSVENDLDLMEEKGEAVGTSARLEGFKITASKLRGQAKLHLKELRIKAPKNMLGMYQIAYERGFERGYGKVPNPTRSEIIRVHGSSEDLHQQAFDAGKKYRLSGAYAETGVSNARVAKYGFLHWYNSLGRLQVKGYRKAKLLKAWMEGWAAGKRVEKRQGNPEPIERALARFEINDPELVSMARYLESRGFKGQVGGGGSVLYYDHPISSNIGSVGMMEPSEFTIHYGSGRSHKVLTGAGLEELKAAVAAGHFKHLKRGNPESAAAELYEEFHGKPPGEILEVVTEKQEHEWLTQLGKLVELKAATITNLDATFTFSDPVPDLCSSEDGRQLYIEGGDQAIDLKAIKMDGDKWLKDSMALGVLYELTYSTEKGFHKFKLTDYFHKLGEETGVQPFLLYDPNNQLLSVTGGQYEIKPEGIVN